MIRLATIGTSAITEKFLSAIALDNRYVYSAVYSRSLDMGSAFAKKYGIDTVFTDLNELSRCENIDAVYIASPNRFHYEQSRLMLENGKNVICEKPITTTAKEYQQLFKIARKNGLVYMEAIMPCYTPARDIILKALKDIGRITSATMSYCQRSSRLDDFKKGLDVNIFNMSLAAGTLMDLGVYCVYGAVDLFGKPKNIIAKASFLENGADGAGNAIFEYDDFNCSLIYCKTGNSVLGSEIIGEDGTIKISYIYQARFPKKSFFSILLQTISL